MPPQITLETAYDRLFELMPSWRAELHSDWIARWIEVSGDSRATAYRMKNYALEIDDALFQVFVKQHPEIPRTRAMIEAHNDAWGIPCRWKQRQPRLKRVSI